MAFFIKRLLMLIVIVELLNQSVFSRRHATPHLAVSVGQSVGRSVTNVFELRAIFASRPQPNRPRLSYHVSGLVRFIFNLFQSFPLDKCLTSLASLEDPTV